MKGILLKLNKALKNFDKKFFRGNFFNKRDRLAISIADHYPSLEYAFLREGKSNMTPLGEVRFSVVIEIAPKDIILLQYNNPYYESSHGRFDMVDKYLEMCKNPNNIKPIDSIVNVNQNGVLLDGIDDVVAAFISRQEMLYVRVNYLSDIPIQPLLFNGDRILYNNSIPGNDRHLYEEQLKTLLHSCQSSFYFFIWPPAMRYKREILNELRQYNKIEITEQNEFALSKLELLSLIDQAYAGAIKSKLIIEEKKRIIIEAYNPDSDKYPICLIQANVPNPYYHFHARTGCLISQLLDEIKRNLRSKWAPMITNYSYDNIIHSTDNQMQNVNIERWLENRVKLI